MKDCNIMIVGVGGQGTLLASRIIGGAALAGGCDVKVSEVHGMSQRGGSVVTYVRFGERVASPLIDKGGADILLSFELLEAVRYLDYLKPGAGTVVANRQQIDPMPVVTGREAYPQGLAELLEKSPGMRGVVFDALGAAVSCGDARAVNTVLIGAMAGLKLTGLSRAAYEDAVRACAPKKALELNLKAFALGFEKGAAQ